MARLTPLHCCELAQASACSTRARIRGKPRRVGHCWQLVEAAESCQLAIIHPGKPWNPDEPNLEDQKQDQGRGWYADLSEADVCALLRNIAADWEYHCFSAGMPAFDSLSAAFGTGARWYERVVHRERRLAEDDAWDVLQAYLARMRGICRYAARLALSWCGTRTSTGTRRSGRVF